MRHYLACFRRSAYGDGRGEQYAYGAYGNGLGDGTMYCARLMHNPTMLHWRNIRENAW